MKQYQFKTNINCSGCVAKVTPHLNENSAIKEWDVDKLLTVQTENLMEEDVKAIVQKAGFKAEKVD